MRTVSSLVRVSVSTELGAFDLGVDDVRAPISAGHFLAYVDGGHLDASSIYRIVTLANQPPEKQPQIEVIQWGWQPTKERPDYPVPPIPHEPTSQTGWRHRDGVISIARFALGTGYGFFICVGDQPELDEGGRRHPDGAGFAAFGEVLSGRDTIGRIFARAETSERLTHPVLVNTVRRGQHPERW